MNILAFAALTITGFTSCAEFGSYAFVHPVIRHLPQKHHIRVEQGLLKTFGRVMPVERRRSTGEVERDKKPLGVLSSFAVLATSDWFRAVCLAATLAN
jgi:hypothetical protein